MSIEDVPRASQEEIDTYREFLDVFLHKLERSAAESEGFMFIPAENIRIIPGRDGSGGVLEIREPENKIGIEEFNKRDKFEKTHPLKIVNPEIEYQNMVFQGKIAGKPFSPDFGGRFALSNLTEIVTAEGRKVSISFLPDTGQRFGKHAKITQTNMARGARFPRVEEMVKRAKKGESNTLSEIQKANPREKIISRPKPVETGLWTVRLTNQKGTRITEIPDSYIYRDPDTGTFEILKMDKQFAFDKADSLDTKIHLPSYLKRAHALFDFNKLKDAKEGDSVELEKLYFDNEPIFGPDDLPENYRQLFIKKGDRIFLKELKMVPPLRAFMGMEQKVIDQVTGDMKNEIRIKMGELFEIMVENVLNIPDDAEPFEIDRPFSEKMEALESASGQVSESEGKIKRNTEKFRKELPANLSGLIKDQPPQFVKWVMDLKGKEIEVKPDFILPDGTFLEVKLSSTEAQADPDQLFRMILYFLINGEEPKIKYYILEGKTSDNHIFPSIKYENIFDDEKRREKIEKHGLTKPIDSWRKYLKQ
jgi:hypothetical protein